MFLDALEPHVECASNAFDFIKKYLFFEKLQLIQEASQLFMQRSDGMFFQWKLEGNLKILLSFQWKPKGKLNILSTFQCF